MAREIPYLHWHQQKDGTEVAHWKPSPALRKAGFQNVRLGTRAEYRQVIEKALDQNEKVEAWKQGAATQHQLRHVPRIWRFADLIEAYEETDEFKALKEKSRAEYQVRFRQLTYWADEGRLPVASIDKAMVTDLKKAMMEVSVFRTAAILRILRLLMRWSVSEKIIGADPTDKVAVPSVPKRQILFTEAEVQDVEAAAMGLQFPSLALAWQLGLWTFQREADLLALTRMNWRTIDNCDAADAAVLANSRGEVKGFRLQQQKTGTWVDCPVPPELHDRIEAAFAVAAAHKGQHLLYDDRDPARAYPDYLFQRRARQAMTGAGQAGKRFRDLRRSGMSMFRDLGVETAGIVTISGHQIIGKASILDDYMPANTRAACAAMAKALRTRKARDARKEAQ
ncbi:hypothetical protein [Novosphingobium sp. UBA1939]|uniref:hypothetical protein n=1 Tax=Novosphingobium sp. UBA1939 TaxID=1946982 RepID=UPI0025CED51D|nr:hypothetical protein [Novosphingobium sp. UBA1939]